MNVLKDKHSCKSELGKNPFPEARQVRASWGWEGSSALDSISCIVEDLKNKRDGQLERREEVSGQEVH